MQLVHPFDIIFPREYLRAALLVSLLSVWVLVGLFYYLNRYTKRHCFTVWTAAWLFYALWLSMGISIPNATSGSLVLILRQGCICLSTVFLLWGSERVDQPLLVRHPAEPWGLDSRPVAGGPVLAFPLL
jgi:hypothetical protein